jgi:phosphatidylserine/phosphatidylglycerophosphate/cardiolipin synthase-like enzyme
VESVASLGGARCHAGDPAGHLDRNQPHGGGEKRVERALPRLCDTDTAEFQRALGSLLSPRLVDGKQVDVLVNGQQIFPAMLRAVDAARETICFETFIDEPMVRHASRAGCDELLAVGTAISEYQPTLLHIKALMVDDDFVSVDSTNFDHRSFLLNE